MANDSTSLDLVNRIIDELQRDDLETQIQNAIVEACDFYAFDSFFQNDAQNTSTTTTIGLATYTAPSDLVMIRQLSITIAASTKYPLTPKSWEVINALDTNTNAPVRGPSVYYAVFNFPAGPQIRLFPTPDGLYPLQYDYIALTAAPTTWTAAETSFWTGKAREMVRHFAKYLLYSDTLNKPDGPEAKFAKEAADLYFQRLKQATGMLRYTGKVKAFW